MASTCERRRLLQPGSRVLAAVSGGPDSLALLYALHALAPRLDLRLAVGHVEHGLRGEESLADADHVRATAEMLGLPFLVRRLQPSVRAGAPPAAGGDPEGDWSTGSARPRSESTQMWARRARYEALCGMAREISAGCVATAHTRDDQAETVLLRVLQGTGIDGLAGIPYRGCYRCPRGDLPIVRPLLDCSREMVESYCRDLGLRPRVDASNASPRYLRNRLRNEVLPLLRERINPNLDAALARLAEVAREDRDVLERLVDEAYAEARVEGGAGAAVVQDTRLWPQATGLRRRLVHRALLLAAPEHPPHFDTVDRILSRVSAPQAGPWRADFHPGLTVELHRGLLTLRRKSAP